MGVKGNESMAKEKKLTKSESEIEPRIEPSEAEFSDDAEINPIQKRNLVRN
jgi:hypothetical protein